MVQLRKPKQFSCGCAALSLLFFGIGTLLYIFYYLEQRDQLVTLTLAPDGTVQAQRSGGGPTTRLALFTILVIGIVLIGLYLTWQVIYGKYENNFPSSISAHSSLTDNKTPQWTPAGTPLQCGEVKVKLIATRLQQVQLVNDVQGPSGRSAEKLLTITVALTNLSTTRKLDYTTWQGQSFSLIRDFAVLRDNYDNVYKRVTFGLVDRPKGQVEDNVSLLPGETITDTLVFEPPIKAAKYLRLELPAENFGGTGMLRFQIPKSAWAKNSK